MSNYVDPTATRSVSIGACRCPVKNHGDTDSIVAIERVGYAIKGAVREASRRSGQEAGTIVAISRIVRSWSLVLPDGKPRPVDVSQIGQLDEQTVEAIVDAIDFAWAEDDDLPNEPSGPSPAGPSETTSPTLTTPSSTETSPSSTNT